MRERGKRNGKIPSSPDLPKKKKKEKKGDPEWRFKREKKKRNTRGYQPSSPSPWGPD